jgi:DNA-3-methyladenine glycosylase
MKKPRNLKRPVDLTRGPGRLATALHIDRRFDGMDMCAPGPLWLGTPVRVEGAIGESVRIGITREAHRKWRFFERGNPYVSGPKRLLIPSS